MDLITIYAGKTPFVFSHATLDKIPYFRAAAAFEGICEDIHTELDPETFAYIEAYVKYGSVNVPVEFDEKVDRMADFLCLARKINDLHFVPSYVEITMVCGGCNSFIKTSEDKYVINALSRKYADFYYNRVHDLIDAPFVNKHFPMGNPSEFNIYNPIQVRAVIQVARDLIEDLGYRDMPCLELHVLEEGFKFNILARKGENQAESIREFESFRIDKYYWFNNPEASVKIFDHREYSRDAVILKFLE
jgi:hypothetical protein